MDSNKTSNYDFFNLDSLPSKIRDKRIIRYLPGFLKSLSILMLFWIFFWMFLEFWYMIYANVFMIFSLLLTTFVLSKKRVELAAHLLLSTTILYVIFTCIIISGTGGDKLGSVHYWLLALIVISYFTFTNKFYVRLIYTTLSIAIILFFEYALIPFDPIYSLNPAIMIWTHLITILSVITAIVFFLHLLVNDYNAAEESLIDSNDRIENILYNILPKEIANRLKHDGETFADGFVECSILFADLVGFTSWSSDKKPEEVVGMLNRIFSKFDDLCDDFKIEKIKTIGDTYMVATGVPEKDPLHAYNITRFALEMKKIINREPHLNLRIGINSGVVVAGIIGKKRFLYDLWGDSVNVAARMESSGIEGEIQISKATYERIKDYDTFEFKNKRSIDIKGKGDMITYLVNNNAI